MLNQETLKTILHYDPKTGIFTRLISSRSVNKGETAGSSNGQGYLRVMLLGKRYCVHRLAFLYMIGKMPDQVDHINHIRNDNRWGNLKASNNQENQRNCSKQKNNSSGHVGVHWNKQNSKWRAIIGVNYKHIHLGYFSKLSEAIKARSGANKKYGFDNNHGI